MPEQAVTQVAESVKTLLENEGSGHDWQHIYRVWKTALKLAEEEKADTMLTSLIALLHDVDDYKVTGTTASEENLPTAHRIMAAAGVAEGLQKTVISAIKTIGFSKSLEGKQKRIPEADVVSDADMLDAIGAVGLARTFTYCGKKGFGMFHPQSLPREDLTQESYRAGGAPAVTHCFEKLLKLRTLVVTAAGKKEAELRHRRMVVFLKDFFQEAAAPEVWLQELDGYDR